MPPIEPSGAPRAAVGWLGSATGMRPSLDFLRSQGYQLHLADGVASLVRAAKSAALDLIVVDLGRAGAEPRRMVRAIRRRADLKGLPILFLKPEALPGPSVAEALSAGADDVVPNDAPPELLAARLEASLRTAQQFRRPESWARHVLRTKDGRLILDIRNFQCHVQEGLDYEPKRLTRREFEVLRTLLKRSNRIVAWRDFIARGWRARKLDEDSRTLVQHVMRLRRKLGGLGRRIETLPGIGYRWID